MTELSYSAYLVHYFVIVWYYSSLMQTLYISIPDLAFTAIAIIFTSFAISIPFAFLIELPSKNLMELILFTMKKYQNVDESEEDAKNTTSDGKNTGIRDNNISAASANLMFLSGVISPTRKKVKED